MEGEVFDDWLDITLEDFDYLFDLPAVLRFLDCARNDAGTWRTKTDARVETGVGSDALGHTKWDEATDGTQNFFGDFGIGERTEDVCHPDRSGGISRLRSR